MKTTLFPFLLIFVVLSAGCKKQDGEQDPVNKPPDSYIKSVSVFDTAGKLLLTNTLYYDSQNRLVKISGVQHESGLDTMLITITLEYGTAKVQLRKTLSTSSQYHETITYDLNSSGLAVSSVHVIYETQTDSSILDNHTLVYNANGYLTTRIIAIPGGNPGTVTYNYSGLNVESVTFDPSSPDSKQLYSYDTGHFNSIGYKNAGVRFLGKSCYNPLIKASKEAANMDMANYSYEYDQAGRISSLLTSGVSMMPGLDFYTVPVLLPDEVLKYTYY